MDYILSNVLKPSGEIQDDYKMLVVTARDGRTYTGNPVRENERQITIRTIVQEALQISKAEIQSRETTESSLMPVGLFETFTEQEVLDLVAYLRSSEQLNLP